MKRLKRFLATTHANELGIILLLLVVFIPKSHALDKAQAQLMSDGFLAIATKVSASSDELLKQSATNLIQIVQVATSSSTTIVEASDSLCSKAKKDSLQQDLVVVNSYFKKIKFSTKGTRAVFTAWAGMIQTLPSMCNEWVSDMCRNMDQVGDTLISSYINLNCEEHQTTKNDLDKLIEDMKSISTRYPAEAEILRVEQHKQLFDYCKKMKAQGYKWTYTPASPSAVPRCKARTGHGNHDD